MCNVAATSTPANSKVRNIASSRKKLTRKAPTKPMANTGISLDILGFVSNSAIVESIPKAMIPWIPVHALPTSRSMGEPPGTLMETTSPETVEPMPTAVSIDAMTPAIQFCRPAKFGVRFSIW
jgi:hypothetical protein